MTNYQELIPFCNERQAEVLNVIIETGSHTKAAPLLGVSRQSVDKHVKRVKRIAATRGLLNDMKKEGTVPEGFYAETSVKRRRNEKTGKMEVIEDWTKSKLDRDAQQCLHEAWIRGLQETVIPAKKAKKPKGVKKLNSDLATAIIFGDAHLGSLAHKIETLGEDYNLEKATQDIRDAMDYCISCAPESEQGWFVNVGDFTHANDLSHCTPGGGNAMDMSARHSVVMEAAAATIRYCIDKMLTKFGKVTVVNARGNHDRDAAQALNMYCTAVYEKEPRVEVLDNRSKFQFIEFGKCLVGVNHGDKINDNRLAGVMTRNAAQAWGRTTFRRWWIGHVHHKNKKETDFGVTIESFHSLTALDEWHASSGYGAERRVTMLTLHKEYGEVNRMEPSLEMVRSFRR